VLLDGRKVAVKVLRPGIARRIARDAEVLLLAARIVERLAPPARRLEPSAFARTVIRATELELDLRLEAAGADELGEVMAEDGYMRAPKVIWDGVGKRVLTMEWAAGQPLSGAAALAEPGIDPRQLADNLIRAFLSQALDHGVFHADLHEGNLFVAAPAQLTAVDFGIIGRLGAPERRYLAEILWGFLQRDYHRVAQVHFDAGYVPSRHSVAEFAQALRAVGEPVFGRAASEVPMSRLLIQLFEITALFEMRLRPELVLLQKTMMTVEGVARRICPDHDIWAAADPVVRRWIARELSPATRIKRLAGEAEQAVRNLARLASAPPVGEPVVAVAPARRSGPALWVAPIWFILGALSVALAAFAVRAVGLG
jgi:ubiquinone biosynthesis protein